MGTIVVEGLGKTYRQYPHKWARLAEWFGLGAHHHENRVLQDINLRIEAGEALGIVGSNGSGKSTLLRLLAGILQPTRGRIAIEGAAPVLLELGLGFHPDFSGRQNAILGGQLRGLSMDEIDALMPEIEAFAEIGEYFDRPLRTYSSGMQVRLAFSVATVRRPSILIVDEVLSVGDSYFQHKSFERIRQFQREGTTLLIVSHDRYAIQTICDRAILLEKGRMTKQGAPLEVLDHYNALMAKGEEFTVHQEPLADGRVATVSGSGEARNEGTRLLDAAGNPIASVNVGDEVTLEVRVRIHAPVSRLVLGFMITDRYGHPVYGINTHRLGLPIVDAQVGELLVYRYRFVARIGKGSYAVSTSLSREDSHIHKNYEWRDNAFFFHVHNAGREEFVGSAWLDAQASIERNADV